MDYEQKVRNEMEASMLEYLKQMDREQYFEDMVLFENTGQLTKRIRKDLKKDAILEKVLDRVTTAHLSAMKKVNIDMNADGSIPWRNEVFKKIENGEGE